MTELQQAAQQSLKILDSEFTTVDGEFCRWCDGRLNAKHNCALEQTITALRAALAEPVQGPREFDNSLGADRFKVVRGAFWWHVLIGDSTTEHGKFHSRASAEKMAFDLLREFRNGAFVQHEAIRARGGK